MAGTVFIISIPNSETERYKRKHNKLSPNKKLDLVQCKSKQNGYEQFDNEYESIDVLGQEKITIKCSKEAITSPRSLSNESVSLLSNSLSKDINNGKERSQFLSTNGSEDIKRAKSCESMRGIYLKSEDSNNSRNSWDGLRGLLTATGKNEKTLLTKSFEKLKLATSTLTEDSTMEEVVTETLRNMKIISSAWIKTNGDTGYHITFSMESSLECEKFLRVMNDWGIGEREGTSVSLMPCTIYHKPYAKSQTENGFDPIEDEYKESAWDRFLFSIRARLNVATIVEEVKKDARITFDFLCLIVIAAILAAFGLVENSTIFLASSMLISPLMGPIIASIFGTVIKDDKLKRMGLVNELIGIFLATFVGFGFGLIQYCIDEKYWVGNGVTTEMLSRCEIRSLVVGTFTALPSGAAVAIAILGENIGSLVGVAISASLLPPAVNAGVLWSLSFVYAVFQTEETKNNSIVKTNIYSDHQSMELAALGSMSMGLTIINIICIYLMGVLFLKIKEVAPINSSNQKQFWKHDIKIARDYYKTCQSQDAISLGKQIADEIEIFKHQEYNGNDIFQRNSLCVQQTCSALSNHRSSRPPMEEIEALFQSRPSLTTRLVTFRRPSVMGKSMSPPVTNRDIFNYLSYHDYDFRRSSHPLDYSTIHNSFGNPKTTLLPLDKIIENIQSGQVNGQKLDSVEVDIESNENETLLSLHGNSQRKFIVTPANDPLEKKK